MLAVSYSACAAMATSWVTPKNVMDLSRSAELCTFNPKTNTSVQAMRSRSLESRRSVRRSRRIEKMTAEGSMAVEVSGSEGSGVALGFAHAAEMKRGQKAILEKGSRAEREQAERDVRARKIKAGERLAASIRQRPRPASTRPAKLARKPWELVADRASEIEETFRHSKGCAGFPRFGLAALASQPADLACNAQGNQPGAVAQPQHQVCAVQPRVVLESGEAGGQPVEQLCSVGRPSWDLR